MNRRDILKLLIASSGSTIFPSPFAAGLQHADSSAYSPTHGNTPSHTGGNSAQNAGGPVFTWLTLGEVKPAGWIKEQMQRDLNEGFAGHLGSLCHEASSDIFVSHRNSAASANDANIYKNNWWNGETEG